MQLQLEGELEECFQIFTKRHMLFKRTYRSFNQTELIEGLHLQDVGPRDGVQPCVPLDSPGLVHVVCRGVKFPCVYKTQLVDTALLRGLGYW